MEQERELTLKDEVKAEEDSGFANEQNKLEQDTSLNIKSPVKLENSSTSASSSFTPSTAPARVKQEADDEEPAQGARPPSPDAGDGSRSCSSTSEEILPDRILPRSPRTSRAVPLEKVDVEAEAESEAMGEDPDPLELDEPEAEVEPDPQPVKERPTRLRRTVTVRQPTLGALSEDSYDDYSSSEEEEMRKTIMIGSAYQAVVPEGFSKYGPNDKPYKHADKLLWEPKYGLDNDTIDQYLESTQQMADSTAEGIDVLPMGAHIRDDEQAMFLLMQCNHNIEEALRKRHANLPPPPNPCTLWTDEECRNFENGILTYGKDFHTIQAQKLRTRTVSEIVQFYYLWKKTERHDVFANKMRPDKKKYMLHPGVTLVVYELLEKENQKEAATKDTVTA